MFSVLSPANGDNTCLCERLKHEHEAPDPVGAVPWVLRAELESRFRFIPQRPLPRAQEGWKDGLEVFGHANPWVLGSPCQSLGLGLFMPIPGSWALSGFQDPESSLLWLSLEGI